MFYSQKFYEVCRSNITVYSFHTYIVTFEGTFEGIIFRSNPIVFLFLFSFSFNS